MLPLLAIAIIESLVLLLFTCAGTAVLGWFEVHSNVWLTVDTLSARFVEPDGSYPREMRSRVAWMIPSDGSLPVTNAVEVGML